MKTTTDDATIIEILESQNGQLKDILAKIEPHQTPISIADDDEVMKIAASCAAVAAHKSIELYQDRFDNVIRGIARVIKDGQESTSKDSTRGWDELRKLTEEIAKIHDAPNEVTHHISISSKRYAASICGLILALLISISYILNLAVERGIMRDNDLKYRYIKMKGEATPQQIADIEEFFKISSNRDKKIMQQNVEGFEAATLQKAAALEKARLEQQQAQKLDEEARSRQRK